MQVNQCYKSPYSKELLYRASINQKGICVSLSGKTRKEAISRTLEEYLYYLYR